jgi:hypothetical protein
MIKISKQDLLENCKVQSPLLSEIHFTYMGNKDLLTEGEKKFMILVNNCLDEFYNNSKIKDVNVPSMIFQEIKNIYDRNNCK